MRVCFDDSLLPYTNQLAAVEVAARTVAEAFLAVCNQFPSLYVQLVADGGAEAAKYALILNDEEALELDDLQRQLVATDEVFLVAWIPHGEAAAIGMAVVNFVAGAGTATAATMAASTALTMAVYAIGSLVVMGIMMALQALIGALTGDMATPSTYSGSLDNSASYTFTGIRNTTASGTPLQVVYGEHRTGGQVISLFTKSDDTPTTVDGQAVYRTDTHLYYQLGISEGEIAGVSNIEINKLPASFYQAVSTDMRPGLETQTPMTDFGESRNTTSIGRKVLNLQGQTLQSIPVTYSSYLPVYGQPRWESPGYTLGNYALAISYYEESGG